MAQFYPGCRECPHRDDTQTLSAKHVARMAETRGRVPPQTLFCDEGVEGIYPNDLRPEVVREMAIALGMSLRRRSTQGTTGATGVSPVLNQDVGNPLVVIAGDGRPVAGELVAGVAEGLRWAGCHVVDIGPASSACLTFAIDHLRASGGILVGHTGAQSHTAALKFWAAGPRPLSAGESLEGVQRIYREGTDRPTRDYGPIERFRADVPYLAAMVDHYHALRPLRFVLDTPSRPVARYIETLTEKTACRILPRRSGTGGLGGQVPADQAHFGVRIDGDGETCRAVDERGDEVSAEQLLLIVTDGWHRFSNRCGSATRGRGELDRPMDGDTDESLPLGPVNRPIQGNLLGLRPTGSRTGATRGSRTSATQEATIVLENESSEQLADAIRAHGWKIVRSDSRRAEMERTLREHNATLGGGPSGRFWYAPDGLPLPDALMTLTRLLVLLSRSDQPLSEVIVPDG